MSRPFRANGCGVRRRPRALPWAGMYRPFGAGRTRTTSISLRSIIFRELVANIIAHREYTSAAPATMMIYTDRVEFKNPNVPHYHGRIDPGNFTPFPKNPTICKFMIQLVAAATTNIEAGEQVTPEVTPEVMSMLAVLDGEMSRIAIQRRLELRDEKHFRENYQQVAVALGLIEMTVPDKPTSRLQKYRLTDKGRAALQQAKMEVGQ